MKSVAAIGNAPITKAIGNLMAGISDVKQVIGTILGSFLSPVAKASLKVNLIEQFYGTNMLTEYYSYFIGCSERLARYRPKPYRHGNQGRPVKGILSMTWWRTIIFR